MKKQCFLFLWVFLPQFLFGQGSMDALASLSPGINEVLVEYDGTPRRLIVTTPKNYKRAHVYPSLFCFHGAGGKADGMSRRWGSQANKRNMIVISLEAVQPEAKWNFKDNFHSYNHKDVEFVSDVVKKLINKKVIDSKAIYATGHSSGGLFCYRLAKETSFFAAFAPMSCGMAKNAHEPNKQTQSISVMQVIGDQDKSYHGSVKKRISMYSLEERIKIWRNFNQCFSEPVVKKRGKEIEIATYTNDIGIEVAFCEVKGEGHHIRRDLRNTTDSIAIEFLLKHRKK